MSVGSQPVPPRAPTLTPAQLSLARTQSRQKRYRCPGLTADDLESEAVLVILAAPAATDHAHLAILIHSRLRNLAAADRRRAGRAGPLPEDLVDPASEGTAGDGPEWRHLLPQLAPQQRVILELSAAGHDDVAIARALDSAPASVRSARSRAIARLRELLLGGVPV